MPFYIVDTSSLLEILIFNFNFRPGDRLKYFVEVFCFSFMYVSTVFLLGTEVYFRSIFFFINCSRYLEYEFKPNEKEVLYIEDGI